MPIPRQQFGVGVVNGVLYAVGGDWTCGGLIANVDAYDPATNTWTSKAPLSAPRASFGVGVVNGILYAIGGQTNGGLSDIVEAYDPSTDTWTTKTPMPTAQMVHAVIVVNGIIYNVGGIDASGVYNLVQAYDPSTDAWTVKSSMPTPRGFLAGGAVNGILYAVGGYNGMDTVEAYNPATDTWTREVPMPTPRAELSAGVIGGTLYVVGGFDGHNSCATNEAFTPRLTNITVSIDIKPGSFPNSINPKSHGKIPVAILSTTEFDAPSQVDRSSLTFGRTGDETSLAFCTIEDVNGDGLLDVVGHFYTEATGFKAGDTQGILKGKNIDGIPLKGTDSVRIVPQK
jgi:N-acetylneuraminic acid mutarotase